MRPLYVGVLVLLISCKHKEVVTNIITAQDLHKANRLLIEVSMVDVFSPPVASRVFAYPNLTAYEIFTHSKGQSFINKLQDSTIDVPKVDSNAIDYKLAAIIGHNIISQKLVFTEKLIIDHLSKLKTSLIAQGYSEKRYKASYDYATFICAQISKWIDRDGYAKVKSDDQFTVKNSDSTWILTPPNFESALEPNWKDLRPIYIKDLKEYYALPRPKFSKDKNSEFYKQAMLVYEQSKKSKDKEFSIAKHWDCNPNEYIESGHNTYFQHKISPPGHWVSIVSTLARSKNSDFDSSLKAYTSVSTAIFDGIISCWHVKYSEQLLRPVTYINRYIDKTWEPYIQTPPFPEYTSGHSVISGAASTILARLYQNMSFIDSTEVQFGLPPRPFSSIKEAAEEASLSRFYGGIHYKFGIDHGLLQGQKIGAYVLTKFE